MTARPTINRMADLKVTDVPEDLVRLLQEEAERTHSSLSDIIVGRLRESMVNSGRAEWMDRWESLPPVDCGPDTLVDILREERENR